jgi:hypothetical protein
MNQATKIQNFNKSDIGLFAQVFNYSKEQLYDVKNEIYAAPFTYDAVLGKAKFANLDTIEEKMNTFEMPLFYAKGNNEFSRVRVRRVYSFFLKDDWVNWFGVAELDGLLSWKHRIVKFNVPEVYKKAWGTPNKTITMYEESVSGRSEFGGIAVEIPYKWGEGKTKRIVAQQIVFVQLKHAAQQILDYQKMIAIEAILNTKNQFLNYHTGPRSSQRDNDTYESFNEEWILPTKGIMNMKKDPMPHLMTHVNKVIMEYNPEWADVGEKAFIFPAELHDQLLLDPNNFENMRVGHKSKKDGFYNKENDKMTGNWIKIKGVLMFRAEKYRIPQFKNSTQLLSSYKQEVMFNNTPNPFDVFSDEVPFAYKNLGIYVKDYKNKSEAFVKFETLLKRISTEDITKKFGSNCDLDKFKTKLFEMGDDDDDEGDDDEEKKKKMECMFMQVAYRISKEHGLSWHLVKNKINLGIDTNVLSLVRLGTSYASATHAQTQTDSFTLFGAPGNEYTKYTNVLKLTIDTLFNFIVKIRPGLGIKRVGPSLLSILLGHDKFKKLMESLKQTPGGYKDGEKYERQVHIWELLHSYIPAYVKVGTGEKLSVTLPTSETELHEYIWNLIGQVSLNNNWEKIIKPAFIENQIMFPMVIGIYREAVYETLSGVHIGKNALKMAVGPIDTNVNKDNIKKKFWVDIERSYGVKVDDPDAFYVIKDLYYKGFRHGCIPTIGFCSDKELQDGIKPTSGKMIPFLLTIGEYMKIKDKIVPIQGKRHDFWGNILSERDSNVRLFNSSSKVHWLLNKYSRGQQLKDHVLFKFHKMDGMIRKTYDAYRGYQRTFTPGDCKFDNVQNSYGCFEYILDGKKKD